MPMSAGLSGITVVMMVVVIFLAASSGRCEEKTGVM
jgi:hypothetical protein